jgi:hypothetical protein
VTFLPSNMALDTKSLITLVTSITSTVYMNVVTFWHRLFKPAPTSERKDFNSAELTLYIVCFRVQLRSVPRPAIQQVLPPAAFSPLWPSDCVHRVRPSHTSQTVFLIKA